MCYIGKLWKPSGQSLDGCKSFTRRGSTMIRALIVDDEKLVRKGLIVTMPWETYQIEIIGEVGNGRAALEFMKEHQVDLLFSDLSMPIMDGFELMKEVRSLYPQTRIVVLTCHQDFDYIQETLRLGAIDYIVKTQLDKGSVEDVLERIVNRMAYELSSWKQPAQAPQAGSGNRIQAAYLLVHKPSIALLQSQDKDDIHAGSGYTALAAVLADDERFEALTPIGQHAGWLPIMDEQPDLDGKLMRQEDMIVIKVMEISGNAADLTQQWRSALHTLLYYKCTPDNPYYHIPYAEVVQLGESVQSVQDRNHKLQALQSEWLSFRWLGSDSEYSTLLEQTTQQHPAPELLQQWLSAVLSHWQPFLQQTDFIRVTEQLQTTSFWAQTVEWISGTRLLIQQAIRRFPYYNEIIILIAKALYDIRSTENYTMSRDDIAVKYNMSRGYFSQCFKDIVGTPYGNYMKELQMEKAQLLLAASDEPIYWISERCGYKDEKYFSKLFREAAGLSPSVYRKLMRGRTHEE